MRVSGSRAGYAVYPFSEQARSGDVYFVQDKAYIWNETHRRWRQACAKFAGASASEKY
jgi:hypothetical protein